MATPSSFGKATQSPDGKSQAVRPETQCRRDLGSFASSFWHHRARCVLPFTQATPKGRHPLPDHALAVKRLARIAYSNLPETQRQQYALEDFTQSINHPSLNHQLQARGVTSLEAALREGEAYLRAQRLHEDSQTENRLPGGVPMTTLEASLHTAADRLLTLMTRATTAIAGAKAPSTTTPPEVSKRKLPSNSHKPRRPPRSREPGKESKQGVPRRTSVRTPRHTPNRWQTPRKTGRSERPQKAFILPLANRFSQLLDTELAGEVHSDIGGNCLPLR